MLLDNLSQVLAMLKAHFQSLSLRIVLELQKPIKIFCGCENKRERFGVCSFQRVCEHTVPWKGGMVVGATAVAAGVCVGHIAIADEKTERVLD